MALLLWCLAFVVVTLSVLFFLGRGGWPRDEVSSDAVPEAAEPPVGTQITPIPVLPGERKTKKTVPMRKRRAGLAEAR